MRSGPPAVPGSQSTGPMSENVNTVRRGLTAFLSGDLEAALTTASPDVVAFRAVPDARTYHGREGIEQMWADWTGEFEGFEMTTGDFTAVGAHVVVEVIQRGRGKRSGAEVEGRFWFVYTLADGYVVRLDAFTSEREALEAASISIVGRDDRS